MVMINLAASVATVGVEVDAIADAKREVIVTERLANEATDVLLCGKF